MPTPVLAGSALDFGHLPMKGRNVENDADPRIYFAAERTLLAWLRTGLAVIGIGFLVARFGLFLTLLRRTGNEIGVPVASSAIGIGFVLLGTAMITFAAWQHTRFCRNLNASQRPAPYWTTFSVGASALMALLGIALALYLLLSISTHTDHHDEVYDRVGSLGYLPNAT